MPDDQDIAEEAMSPEQLRALHAKFDQNGDGKVSLSEVLDFARHMSKAIAGKDVTAILAEIDTDKDGNLPELWLKRFNMIQRLSVVHAIFTSFSPARSGKLSLQEHLNDLHQQADGGDDAEMKELDNRKSVSCLQRIASFGTSFPFYDAFDMIFVWKMCCIYLVPTKLNLLSCCTFCQFTMLMNFWASLCKFLDTVPLWSFSL